MSMNYYTRTQQVLNASAAQSQARMAAMDGLRGTTRARARRLAGLGQGGNDVPAGSQLLYRVTFSGTSIGTLLSNLKSLVPGLSSSLISNWGIKVLSESDNGGSFGGGPLAMSLTVMTTIDYGAAADIQANIDHELYNTGTMAPGATFSSTISIITAGGSTPTPTGWVDPQTGLPITAPGGFPGSASAGSSQGIGDFLSNNWPWLALIAAGLIAAEDLL